MTADINKFSLAQATSNNSGKTSGSGTAGLYLVFIGGLIGVMGAIAGLFMESLQASNVLLFASGIVTSGVALLGYRKSVDKTTIENTSQDPIVNTHVQQ